MKRIIFSLLLVAGTLIASKSDAQVCIRGGIRIGIPVPRVYCAPPVVYPGAYVAPYYGSQVIVPGPYYGHRWGYYHDRRWRRYDRW